MRGTIRGGRRRERKEVRETEKKKKRKLKMEQQAREAGRQWGEWHEEEEICNNKTEGGREGRREQGKARAHQQQINKVFSPPG